MYRLTHAGRMKGQMFFGLLALLAMLLTGCGSSNGSGNQLDANQIFTWPLTNIQNFNSLVLDPANVTDYYSATVINAIYGGLVTTDHNLNVVPNMATWEVSPDGRTYTFHLKPDLRFSDGTPLTAQDFAYSIDRALDPKVCVPFNGPTCGGGPAASYLVNIKGSADRLSGAIPTLIGPNLGLQAPDTQTLVIKLDQPVAYFLEALTYPTSYPVEKKLVDKYGNDYAKHNDWTAHLDEGGDSGPFILKSHDNTKLILTPNRYWFGPKITLKEIVRPYVSNSADTYNGYRQGKYDYGEVPAQEYQAARDQEDFHEVGVLTTNYIGINQANDVMKDIGLRQALALAINKQLIADRVLNGSVYPTNHIVPQGMPGFDPDLTAPGISSRTVTGDVDTAQKLLKDFFARNPQYNNTLTLNLAYNDTDADTERTAQALKAMWETVLSNKDKDEKITIEFTKLTFHDLVTAVIGNTVGNKDGALQMWLLGWIADYPDPQDWLSLQFDKTSPYNAENYQDGNGYSAWKLMGQADVEQDQTKRMSLYNQAEQQLVNNVTWIPYAQTKGIWRIRTYIQGFNPSALNLLSDLDWAKVVVLAH